MKDRSSLSSRLLAGLLPLAIWSCGATSLTPFTPVELPAREPHEPPQRGFDVEHYAIELVLEPETRSITGTCRVRFAAMSPEEISWYAASGEPLDKAGAYAVQGLGALFVESVEGNYSNVVGLPLPLTYRLLRAAGFSLRA